LSGETFAVAINLLRFSGYRKNHYCHYARIKDKNLYYTHARRGEDLLALGASADGVFGGFHYRCPTLSGKSLQEATDHPILQGGIREDPERRRISQVVAQLMTGVLERKVAIQAGSDTQVDRWLFRRLHAPEKNDAHHLSHTGNGSWLIYRMIREIEEIE
jgi:hypothetical protein